MKTDFALMFPKKRKINSSNRVEIFIDPKNKVKFNILQKMSLYFKIKEIDLNHKAILVVIWINSYL